MSDYVVAGPCAVVHIGEKIQYLYQGAAVPDGVAAEEVERLVGRGLLAKPDAEAEQADAEQAEAPKRAARGSDAKAREA